MGTEGFEPATFSGTGLACRRGGHGVFAGLDFAVRAGEVLVLRGANGSGKSSLLRVMAGLTPPSEGVLRWNDTPIGDDSEPQRGLIRFIGHLDGVKPALSVAENLAFWAKLWGNTPDSGINAALQRLGVGRLRDLPARVLSAGQRHRLALARLLIAPAPLWLLDEPTNALDDDAFTILAEMIADHRRAGGMAVIASHGAVPATDTHNLDLGPFTARATPHWSDAA